MSIAVCFLLAESACPAVVELAAQPLLDKHVQPVAQCFNLDVLYYLSCKSIHQQMACLIGRDAALLHVEECIIIQLTYSRTMAALHVIGIYLQLGLCIHVRIASETQVTVGLLRDGLLCVGAYEHFACKDSCRLLIKNILVEFVAVAVACLVVHNGAVVGVLALVAYDKSIDVSFCSLALE